MDNKNKLTGYEIFIQSLLNKQKKEEELKDESVSVEEIDLILNQLEKNKSVLVYGEVQSGKTARIKKLADKVIDESLYNIIVVLGGTNIVLKDQTVERVNADVNKKLSKKRYLEINSIDQLIPAVKKGSFISLIIKKDAADLEKLVNAIKDLPDSYSLLLVDDECDFGSINTSSNTQKPTTINDYISKIISRDKSKLCMFTATPYANILDKNSNIGVMIKLDSHENYTGLDQFNEKEPSPYFVTNQRYELNEQGIINLLERGLKFYVFSTAMYRINKKENIFFEFLINLHAFKNNIKYYLNAVYQIYDNLKSKISKMNSEYDLKKIFLEQYNDFFNKKINIDVFAIINEIKLIWKKIDGNFIEMDGDNHNKYTSKNKGELDCPKIICAGNLASRGVTFNNLLTTIMLNEPKDVNALDTFLQRARWFGYRNWMIDYMKIIISSKSLEALNDGIKINKFFIKNSTNNIIVLNNEFKKSFNNIWISSKYSNKGGGK